MRHLLLLPIAFILGAAAPASRPAVHQGGDAMAERMLASHNAARAVYGLRPMRWSPALARDAAAYAAEMAATGVFEHAEETGTEANPQGENLWMGTRRAYSYEDMVGDWVAEKRWFRRGAFPNISTTPRWEDVGHYTQIIWHDTTEVGCALADDGEWDYLVCRYARAGNWEGEDPLGIARQMQVASAD